MLISQTTASSTFASNVILFDVHNAGLGVG